MLSSEFQNKLDQLRIQSQKPFRGKLRGERRSQNRGMGLEFTDYRRYEPGDDLRYLDWNVYARLEKPFIKLFQADEELTVTILIDTSQSMSFGEPSKLEYVKQIACALGYIALANTDRVSIYTLSNRLSSVLPSTYGKSQYTRIEKVLTRIQPGGITHLNECLTHLSVHQPSVGIVVILSDFLDSDGYSIGINSLLGRGYTVSLIHIQSSEELEFLPQGEWQLEDSETGETKEITINDETLQQFREEMNTFRNTLRNYCRQKGVNYINLSTEMDIESVILEDFQNIGVIENKH